MVLCLFLPIFEHEKRNILMIKAAVFTILLWGSTPSRFENFIENSTIECRKQESAPNKEIALLLLKKWEGLILVAEWDTNAYRVGWGTVGRKYEKISLEQADIRLRRIFNSFHKRVVKKYPNLGDWEQCILTVMLYNVGNFGKDLDLALKIGNLNLAASIMVKYVYSAGNRISGLELRREEESRLLITKEGARECLILDLKYFVNKHIKKSKNG